MASPLEQSLLPSLVASYSGDDASTTWTVDVDHPKREHDCIGSVRMASSEGYGTLISCLGQKKDVWNNRSPGEFPAKKSESCKLYVP